MPWSGYYHCAGAVIGRWGGDNSADIQQNTFVVAGLRLTTSYLIIPSLFFMNIHLVRNFRTVQVLCILITTGIKELWRQQPLPLEYHPVKVNKQNAPCFQPKFKIYLSKEINPFSASLIYMCKPQSVSLDLRVKKGQKKFYSDRSIEASFYDIELD